MCWKEVLVVFENSNSSSQILAEFGRYAFISYYELIISKLWDYLLFIKIIKLKNLWKERGQSDTKMN